MTNGSITPNTSNLINDPCDEVVEEEEQEEDDANDNTNDGTTGNGGSPSDTSDGTGDSPGGGNGSGTGGGGGWYADADEPCTVTIGQECTGGGHHMDPDAEGCYKNDGWSVTFEIDCGYFGNARTGGNVDPCVGDVGILIDPTIFENNCDELKKLLETPNYAISPPAKSPKNAILDLEGDLDEDGERGFIIRDNSAGETFANPVSYGSTAQSKIRYPAVSSVYGGMHTHQDDNRNYPMFSGGDIKSLYEFSQNFNNGTTVDKSLFVHIVVTYHGNYAIKIDDPTKLEAIKAIFDDEGDLNEDGIDEVKLLNRRYNNLFNKYFDAETNQFNGSPANFQKAYLQFITEKYDFGVSLYKANDDLTNWSKLTLSDTSDSSTVNETPCEE